MQVLHVPLMFQYLGATEGIVQLAALVKALGWKEVGRKFQTRSRAYSTQSKNKSLVKITEIIKCSFLDYSYQKLQAMEISEAVDSQWQTC